MRLFRVGAGIVLRAAMVIAVLTLVSQPSNAGQTRTAQNAVYSDAQARRGQAVFKEKCTPCHGAMLEGSLGPPLTGEGFTAVWGKQTLSDLAGKIRSTMPANQPGTLSVQESVDLVAYILQVGKFPAGQADLGTDEAGLKQITLSPGAGPVSAPIAPVASHAPFPPAGNLGQLMKGILFPSSNIIFNVQSYDPGEQKTGAAYQPPTGSGGFSWVDWGAGIYAGWELVDYAAVSLAEAAPLLLTPGRRCENGRPVPVERADWVKYTEELVAAGKAAYKASQSRNRDAVSDVSNDVADACLHCHEVYRDKPGGTTIDPSNKAARCVP
jgi:S-disulfanyl-L-cysteine oxidoreductase SoxD